jgi:hypothetical protein
MACIVIEAMTSAAWSRRLAWVTLRVARVVEVMSDREPARVNVDDLPSDVASAAGKSSIAARAPIRRLQGSEGPGSTVREAG